MAGPCRPCGPARSSCAPGCCACACACAAPLPLFSPSEAPDAQRDGGTAGQDGAADVVAPRAASTPLLAAAPLAAAAVPPAPPARPEHALPEPGRLLAADSAHSVATTSISALLQSSSWLPADALEGDPGGPSLSALALEPYGDARSWCAGASSAPATAADAAATPAADSRGIRPCARMCFTALGVEGVWGGVCRVGGWGGVGRGRLEGRRRGRRPAAATAPYSLQYRHPFNSSYSLQNRYTPQTECLENLPQPSMEQIFVLPMSAC
jgi:hypothetical protein